MFIEKDKIHYEKIKPFCKKMSVLVLGNQYSQIGDVKTYLSCAEYKTLDPDEGDYLRDIQSDLSDMDQKWDVVFNLGTLEHVWDVHTSYSNAARMVKVGGYYIGHAPVQNYNNHGVHITNAQAILKFFEINGFENVENWQSGNVIQWNIEKKISHQIEFKRPQQVWVKGLSSHFE